MVYLIYPERRMVDESQVIVWAKDSLCNAALALAGGIVGETEAERIIDQILTDNAAMTLQDAMAILEDDGSCTFGRAPVTPLVQVGGLDCIF